MLLAYYLNLSSRLRRLSLSAMVSSFQAWIRQEIVDDDPWDVETLHPSSFTLPVKEFNLEKTNSEELAS